jgi:hypothetical protein
MELDDRKKLNEFIGMATRANSAHLNQEHIQEIKKLLKRSRDNVALALDLMMAQLKENNSQVRFLALGLINWLIERSPVARVSFAEQLPNLIPLFIAKNIANSNKLVTQLPEPAEYATKLSALGTTLLQEWTDKYAVVNAFKRARSYLDTLKTKTPQLRENTANAAPVINPVHQHAIEDELHELESQLLQIENAVQVLQTTPDQIEQFLAELQRASTEPNNASATQLSDEFEDVEFEEVECGPATDLTLDEVIRTHGLGSDTYELELTVPVLVDQPEHKSDGLDAQPVEPLTELLSSTVLPLLKEAQSALARLLNTLRDLPEGNFKARAVARSLHLQQRLTGVKGKLVECGVVQEKRILSAENLLVQTNNNNNNNNPVAPTKAKRKRKSVGSESKRPKQRRKTR